MSINASWSAAAPAPTVSLATISNAAVTASPSSLLVLLCRAWGKPLIANSLSRDLVCQVRRMRAKTSLFWASQPARYPNSNDLWKTSSENRWLQCWIVFLFPLRGLHLANFNAWAASDIPGFTFPCLRYFPARSLPAAEFHSQNYLQALALSLSCRLKASSATLIQKEGKIAFYIMRP